ILVDEYQDTNLIQAEIVDFLASENRNVLVVGDDSQSIYSFRGANFANIIDFPHRYPDCTIYKLETNYRSVPPILSLANGIIAINTRQFAKTLRPVRSSGEKPVVVPTRNVPQQAEFVASQILTMRENGYSLKDLAVLYRAHYQSLELQIELTRRGIPFDIRSGIRFFEQAHIKDVISYLKVIANPRDEMAWKRMLKIYPGIGKVSSEKVWNVLKEAADPLEYFRQSALSVSLPSGVRSSLSTVGVLLSELETIDFEPGTMIKTIVERGYGDYLSSKYPDHRDRLQDIEQLSAFATQYSSLDHFLSELALLGELEGENVAAGSIPDEKLTLSTIHQAKGLEWPGVFIIWLCEGAFPSGRSVGKEEDIEEERRLFYVACTRAKDYLFLTYPLVSEGTWNPSFIRKPSRFVRELKPSCYTKWFVDQRGKSW
ncbi:MAG: ATP-dependent helicase, partial [Candidatus Atribacteria bacterium]|nr:ATP-dependent helicase [Candidatus Atribacteria bacterium]